MEKRSKLTAALLGALVLIGVYNAQQVTALDLKSGEAIIAGAANVILVFFVLALLIERACEVAMDLLTAAGTVPSKDTSDTGGAKSDRRMVSIFLCLAFSIVITLAGLRLVEMVLTVVATTQVQLDGYFTAADALLTALILAGGSDGIHQILSKLLGNKSPLPPLTE